MALGRAMPAMLLLLLNALIAADAKVIIPLQAGWSATFHRRIQFSNGLFWHLVTSDNATLQSPNSTFALGLFSLDKTLNYKLIICILPDNSSTAVDVWNVGKTFSQNIYHILTVPADGSALQLVDSENKVVWSVDGGVSGLELAETGNLIVYNSSNDILWQSFDHPTDSVLPGQTLDQGMKLTASNSSGSGPYSLVLEPSGLVLYYTDADPPLPYLAWTVNRTSDYSMALKKCGDSNLNITYEYDISDVGAAYFNFSGGCSTDSSDLGLTMYGFKGKNDPRFVRVESDGNLVLYLWQADFVREYAAFVQKDCNLPNACGSYGVCSTDGCTCPTASSSSNMSSGQFFSNYTSEGCRSSTAVTCDAGSMKNHRLFNMSNITYFSNRFLTPLNLSQEACQSSCLSNCSCMAAFYEVDSTAKGCFHVFKQVSSLKKVSSDSGKAYYAYLKVQLPTSSSKSQNTKLIVILSVVIGLGLFLVCVFLALVYYYRQKTTEDDFLNAMPGLPHRFSLKELEAATAGFTHILGAGGFGTVFGGKLEDGRAIAVKRLEGVRQGLKEFETEVKTLGGISHVNLVRLYGFCIEGNDRLLVYENMSRGSLDRWLFSNDPSRFLPWKARINIAIDAAEGLTYLHEELTDPVLHLDIKPQNILLDANFKAKVADFGMAKLVNAEMSVTQVRGTPGYIAPEWPRHYILTKKCDVYSYGVVLLEMITGRKILQPVLTTGYGYSNVSSSAAWLPSWALAKIESGDVADVIDPTLKGQLQLTDAESIIRLACWCVQDNPDLRPSMSQIVQKLQTEVKAEEPSGELSEELPFPTGTMIPNFSCSSRPIIDDEYSLVAR